MAPQHPVSPFANEAKGVARVCHPQPCGNYFGIGRTVQIYIIFLEKQILFVLFIHFSVILFNIIVEPVHFLVVLVNGVLS